MKKCPFCAENIHDQAIKCRYCGELLDEDKAIISVKPSGSLQFLGALLFLIGVSISVYFFALYDTSVQVPQIEVMGQTVGGQRVHNLGKLQTRQNGLLVGCVTAMLGFLTVVFGGKHSSRTNVLISPSIPSSNQKQTTQSAFSVSHDVVDKHSPHTEKKSQSNTLHSFRLIILCSMIALVCVVGIYHYATQKENDATHKDMAIERESFVDNIDDSEAMTLITTFLDSYAQEQSDSIQSTLGFSKFILKEFHAKYRDHVIVSNNDTEATIHLSFDSQIEFSDIEHARETIKRLLSQSPDKVQEINNIVNLGKGLRLNVELIIRNRDGEYALISTSVLSEEIDFPIEGIHELDMTDRVTSVSPSAARNLMIEAMLSDDKAAIIEALDMGAPINDLYYVNDNLKLTPLVAMIIFDDISLTESVLERGASPNIDVHTGSGLTSPMAMLISTWDDLETKHQAMRLLFRYGCDPNRTSASQYPCLLLAASAGSSQDILELLAGGADIDHQEHSGYTALHLAIITPNISVARELVRNGAKDNILTKNGLTARDLARSMGIEEEVWGDR